MVGAATAGIYGGVREEMFWLEGRRRLWAMLHLPARARPGGREPGNRSLPLAVLFCSPFAEEEKCSRRLYVELARALARRGVAALRFSYAGTGDSEGEFHEFRLAGALEDTRRALSYLQQTLETPELAVFGLRLGATIALQAAASPGVGAAALWSPVVDGRSYVRMNFRRKAIRQMVTTAEAGGQSAAGPTDDLAAAGSQMTGRPAPATGSGPAAEDLFDFDGYAVARELWADMEGLRLEPPPAWRGRSLVVSVGPGDRPGRESSLLARSLEESGATVELQHVTAQPFWNLLGLVECPEIIERTANWLLNQGRRPPNGAV